jgi:hypothetical protein
MIVLVVNEDRYLINEHSKASDNICKVIINDYPSDAVVDFDEVRLSDVKPKSLNELLNN